MSNGDEPILTRAGWVAQQLREVIRSGALEPGSTLRQTRVAAQFGVSTTPVREAFAMLMHEGLVVQAAHKSVIVFRPATAELAEIYEIRTELEPLAARLAAERISDAQLEELDAIIVQMRTATPDQYIILNSALHNRIYEIADHPRLLDILSRLGSTSTSYINLTVVDGREDPEYRLAVHSQHEQIVEALRRRDGNLVAAAMKAHLATSASHIAQLVNDKDPPMEG